MKRVAIITGAANGIGRAVSLMMAKDRVPVVLVDTDEANILSLSEEIKNNGGEATNIVADVSSIETSKMATNEAAKLGVLYYLFNNAGVETVSTIEEIDIAEFQRTMKINLEGYFLMAKAVVPVMKSRDGGVIINNSSDAGLRGMRKSISYASSKAGVIQLTKSLCLDLAGCDIRVNCICPGVIKTALCDRFNHEIGVRSGVSGEEAQSKFIEKYVPLNRYGTPEEVAELVGFLFSDKATYINGSIITIDGGLTAGI